MFIRFSHPCVVTDVLTDVMIGIGIDMLSDMEMIVTPTPAITLEFVVTMPAIDVDMIADENINGLVAVMNPLSR